MKLSHRFRALKTGFMHLQDDTCQLFLHFDFSSFRDQVPWRMAIFLIVRCERRGGALMRLEATIGSSHVGWFGPESFIANPLLSAPTRTLVLRSPSNPRLVLRNLLFCGGDNFFCAEAEFLQQLLKRCRSAKRLDTDVVRLAAGVFAPAKVGSLFH